MFFHDIKDWEGRERYSLILGIHGCAAQQDLIFEFELLDSKTRGWGTF